MKNEVCSPMPDQEYPRFYSHTMGSVLIEVSHKNIFREYGLLEEGGQFVMKFWEGHYPDGVVDRITADETVGMKRISREHFTAQLKRFASSITKIETALKQHLDGNSLH